MKFVRACPVASLRDSPFDKLRAREPFARSVRNPGSGGVPSTPRRAGSGAGAVAFNHRLAPVAQSVCRMQRVAMIACFLVRVGEISIPVQVTLLPGGRMYIPRRVGELRDQVADSVPFLRALPIALAART